MKLVNRLQELQKEAIISMVEKAARNGASRISIGYPSEGDPGLDKILSYLESEGLQIKYYSGTMEISWRNDNVG
jgi:hypothetical protein